MSFTWMITRWLSVSIPKKNNLNKLSFILKGENAKKIFKKFLKIQKNNQIVQKIKRNIPAIFSDFLKHILNGFQCLVATPAARWQGD